MNPVEFEAAMRRWGWVYGEQPDRELPESARSPDVHPIARAMRFAPGTADKRRMTSYARTLRDGERSWSRDPIPCVETRQSGWQAPVAPSQSDGAEIIQRAWIELTRESLIIAEAVRLEYQIRGEKQREKAQRMGLGANKYRELLAEGRGWIRARVA